MILNNISKWERRLKNEFEKNSAKFKNEIERGIQKGYAFNEFSQDLFSACYKVKPDLDNLNSTPGTNWAKKAIEELKSLPEFESLRKSRTQCDPVLSGMGATTLAKHFAESLKEVAEPNPDTIQKEIDNLIDFIENMPEGDKKYEALEKLEQAEKTLEQSTAAWAQAVEDMDTASLRQSLRRGIESASQEIDDMSTAMAVLGAGSATGNLTQSDITQAVNLFEYLQNDLLLKKIIQLAGKFKFEADRVQRNKKQPGPDELTDIEIGNDIGRLLPTELSRITNPMQRLLFYRDYVEGKLIQYKLETKEKEQKGPIVVCLDASGSMRGAPEVWEKAIALTLCSIALREKRDIHILYFATSVIAEFTLEKGRGTTSELLEIMKTSCNGSGTNFMAPLLRATEVITEEKAFNKADIIFITDGQATVTDAFLKEFNQIKNKKDTSVYGICIGNESGFGTVEKFADNCIKINDLKSINDIKDTVLSI